MFEIRANVGCMERSEMHHLAPPTGHGAFRLRLHAPYRAASEASYRAFTRARNACSSGSVYPFG